MWSYLKNSLLLNSLLFVALLIVGTWTYSLAREAIILGQEYRFVQEKAADAESKKAVLERQIAELNTSVALEREAKRRLNLKNPGEQVVVVVPDTAQAPTSTPPLTWWQKVKGFFGWKP